MNLQRHISQDGKIEATSSGWLLSISDGSDKNYRLAQLENYWGLARKDFPSKPPINLSLRARVSSQSIPGTWGFGFWNDPFPSFGLGGYPPRLPRLPNAVWFFYASPKNYLSFRADKPAQGFIVQSFRSPEFHPLLVQAGFTLPFSRTAARGLLSRVIEEDSAAVDVDLTQWHQYRLHWSPARTAFWVDEALVIESQVSPEPPLGLVIWIDNQHAAFTPQGKLSWGIERNPTGAWLEIEDLHSDGL